MPRPRNLSGLSSFTGLVWTRQDSIGVHPHDFFVFNRTLGGRSEAGTDVQVHNSSMPSLNALWADEYCGPDTSLIYYLTVGTVLTRPPLRKDLLDLNGNLLLDWTPLVVADGSTLEDARMVEETGLFTRELFGFQAKAFGGESSEVMLPADVNKRLRDALPKLHGGSSGSASSPATDADAAAAAKTNALRSAGLLDGVDDALKEMLHPYAINMVQLLCQMAFSQPSAAIPMGFHNPSAWNEYNVFADSVRVWDIPPNRPPFTCRADLQLAKTHNIAPELRKMAEGSRHCEFGWLLSLRDEAEDGRLAWKEDVEFSEEWAVPMPDIASEPAFAVSVVLQVVAGGMELVPTSLSSIIARMPFATEVVVLGTEADQAQLQEVVDFFQHGKASAPFPIRLLIEEEEEGMDVYAQQQYNKLRSDLFTSPESAFVLHMDSDKVIFEDVDYRHLFRFGKPVLPYRSFTDEGDTKACWQAGTSKAMGAWQDLDFSLYDTLVYPKAMYPALRKHLSEQSGVSFVDFMRSRQRGSCRGKALLTARKCAADDTLHNCPGAETLFSDTSAMGAFLHAFMPEEVSAVPVDPWGRTASSYAHSTTILDWSCRASASVFARLDEEAQALYLAGLAHVSSDGECKALAYEWASKVAERKKAKRKKVKIRSLALR